MKIFKLPVSGGGKLYFSLCLLFLTSFFYSGTAGAVTCVSGCGNVSTSVNRNLASNENFIGQSMESDRVQVPSFTLKYSAGGVQMWYRYAGGEIPSNGYNSPGWVYSKVDDYISIALKNELGCLVIYYPANIRQMNSDCKETVHNEGATGTTIPSYTEARLRIDKKIISGVYSKNILLAEMGNCQPVGCKTPQVIAQRIYVNVNITVPQSCEINAGQVVDINFGDISSGAFKTAGAAAQGVRPQSRDISVKCDNIAGNAQLTMRLQADKTNGNIVVSDENNDVGFRVTNNNGTPLIPNNLSSVIPFTLDSTARQNVTLQFYPVSVTGNKPAEGPVTSRGYLRVDFP